MTKTLTFNELRAIKDALPHGSMQKIADTMGIEADTVRNYFGAQKFDNGKGCGVHIEPGPNGGLVTLDDTAILEHALRIIEENKK